MTLTLSTKTISSVRFIASTPAADCSPWALESDSRLKIILARISSVVSYRFQLVMHSFRAGFRRGVFCAVVRDLVVRLATCQVRIFSYTCLIGGNERADLLSDP